MSKITIDYRIEGTVEVGMDEKEMTRLKSDLSECVNKGTSVSKNYFIEERFADEISQHFKYMSTVEIEDWEIEE